MTAPIAPGRQGQPEPGRRSMFGQPLGWRGGPQRSWPAFAATGRRAGMPLGCSASRSWRPRVMARNGATSGPTDYVAGRRWCLRWSATALAQLFLVSTPRPRLSSSGGSSAWPTVGFVVLVPVRHRRAAAREGRHGLPVEAWVIGIRNRLRWSAEIAKRFDESCGSRARDTEELHSRLIEQARTFGRRHPA